MTQTLYAQSITCSEPTTRNTQPAIRTEIAILVRDGVLVWCTSCQLSHHISKDECLSVWDGSNGLLQWRKTCDEVTARNQAGRDKLYSVIDETGVSCWCKRCQKVHVIAREQCLQVWG